MSNSGYEWIKPWIDMALALVMLLFSAPLILFLMFLVKLNSKGPAIYTQKRLGLRGRVFTMYKIRTMYHDSERHCGPTWCVPGDPRITPLGKWLRWFHVDELPQLVNVLKRDMSLVGPRPERPEFLERLEGDLPEYRWRLLVRPGVTGLAQVQQPPDTDLASVRRKLDYDLYYVERLSFWLDLRVILGTVLKCLGIPFDRIGRILRFPDPGAQSSCESLLLESELTANPLVAAAVILIIGAGLVHGAWTNRWGPPAELVELAARFDQVPMGIGDWKATEQEVPAAVRAMSGAVACFSRQYTNRNRGLSVSVLLLGGLPGKISTHTPDVCYPGAGYVLSALAPYVTDYGSGGQRAEFRTAVARREETNPSVLRIFWGWNAGNRWSAPEVPRWSYATESSLCKLYVIRETAGDVVDPAHDPCNELLSVLLPELDRVVFSTPR
jgi:lipopolysaccharide/colanic/teichoic acid biosynthesis glycosyltransferase